MRFSKNEGLSWFLLIIGIFYIFTGAVMVLYNIKHLLTAIAFSFAIALTLASLYEGGILKLDGGEQ